MLKKAVYDCVDLWLLGAHSVITVSRAGNRMQTLIAAVSTSVLANNHERIAQTSDVQSSQLTKGPDTDTNRAKEPSDHTYTFKPHIVYDFDKQANRIWLNIIDPQSGKIIWKIPPQAVRDLLDSLSSSKFSSFNKTL